MKITLQTKELQTALAFVGKGIISSPILPVLENVLFIIEKDTVTLVGADARGRYLRTRINRVAISIEEQSEPEYALIPYADIKATVSKAKSNTINLETNVGPFRHLVSFGRSSYEFTGDNPIDYPAKEQTGDVLATIRFEGTERDIFRTALVSTYETVSKDELRPAMCGVYTIFKNEGYTLASTDGHALVRYNVPRGTFEPCTTVLRLPFVISLIDLLDGSDLPLVLEYRSNTVTAIVGNDSSQTQRIEDRFPDYETAIRLESPIYFELERKPFEEAIKRLLIVAEKEGSQIRLLLSADTLEISADNPAYGNTGKEVLDCVNNLGDSTFEIGVNAKKLIGVLNTSESQSVKVELESNNRAILFTTDDAYYLALCMPSMLNPTTKVY